MEAKIGAAAMRRAGWIRRWLLAASAAWVLSMIAPAAARADTGHVAVTGGALAVTQGPDTTWHPHLRTELAFRIWGPLELGGFFQMQTLELLEMHSFGGGLVIAVRPDLDLWGFVPSLELTGSRNQLPTADGRMDALGVGLGAGVGYELDMGLGFEARLTHQWFFDEATVFGDQDTGGPSAIDGWTVTLGVTYRLP